MPKQPPEQVFRCIFLDGTCSAIMTWDQLRAKATELTARGVRAAYYWSPDPTDLRPLKGDWLELPLAVPGLLLAHERDATDSNPCIV